MINKSKYLITIKDIIDTNFRYFETWNSEFQNFEKKIGISSADDLTITNTKDTFVIVGLNSVNEIIFENILNVYITLLLNYIKSIDSNLNLYIKHEIDRISCLIDDNHNGSMKGFQKMLGKYFIGGNFIENFDKKLLSSKDDIFIINDLPVKTKNGGKKTYGDIYADFKKYSDDLYYIRNSKAHNCVNFFNKNHNMNLDRDLNKIITGLKYGFYLISENFIDVANDYFTKNPTLNE